MLFVDSHVSLATLRPGPPKCFKESRSEIFKHMRKDVTFVFRVLLLLVAIATRWLVKIVLFTDADVIIGIKPASAGLTKILVRLCRRCVLLKRRLLRGWRRAGLEDGVLDVGFLGQRDYLTSAWDPGLFFFCMSDLFGNENCCLSIGFGNAKDEHTEQANAIRLYCVTCLENSQSLTFHMT